MGEIMDTGLGSDDVLRQLRAIEAWASLPILMFFYALEYYLLKQRIPEWAPAFGLGFSAFILMLYQFAHKWRGADALDSGPMISGFIGLVWLHAFYLDWMPREIGPWLGLGLMMGLPLLSLALKLQRQWLLGTALLFPVLVEFGRCLQDARLSLLVLAHAQAMAALMRMGMLLDLGAGARYFLSMAWGAYALALIGLAYSLKDKLLARSALGVLVLASVKAMIFDLGSAGGLLRVLAFLGLGAILYVAGLFFRQMQDWQET